MIVFQDVYNIKCVFIMNSEYYAANVKEEDETMKELTGRVLSVLELISRTWSTERTPLFPLTRLRALERVIFKRRLLTKRLMIL